VVLREQAVGVTERALVAFRESGHPQHG